MSLLSHHELCKTVCSSGSLCPCVSHRVLRGVQSLAHQRHHYSRFSPGVQPAPITDGARSADGKAGRLPSVLLRQTPPYFALLILGCQKKGGRASVHSVLVLELVLGSRAPPCGHCQGLCNALGPRRPCGHSTQGRGGGAGPCSGRFGAGPGGAAAAPPAPSAIGGAGPAGAGGRDSGGEPGPSEPRSPLCTAVPWWGITAASPVNGPCSPRVPRPD